MVALPRTCQHCGTQMMHYGACNCPRATLDWVEVHRADIVRRTKHLDKIEANARESLVTTEQIADALEQKE